MCSSDTLLVYLDSSDFSNLSQSDLREPLTEIRDTLIRWSDERVVKFCFSDVHAYELAPTDVESAGFASRRIQFLHRLCAGNGLLASDRILHREAINLRDRELHSPWHSEPILDVPGGWIPDIIESSKAACKERRALYLQSSLEIDSNNRDRRRRRCFISLVTPLTHQLFEYVLNIYLGSSVNVFRRPRCRPPLFSLLILLLGIRSSCIGI